MWHTLTYLPILFFAVQTLKLSGTLFYTSPENKKKAVEGITKVFEDLGVPKEAVEIVIYEAPKSNWGLMGSCIQKDTHTPARCEIDRSIIEP